MKGAGLLGHGREVDDTLISNIHMLSTAAISAISIDMMAQNLRLLVQIQRIDSHDPCRSVLFVFVCVPLFRCTCYFDSAARLIHSFLALIQHIPKSFLDFQQHLGGFSAF